MKVNLLFEVEPNCPWKYDILLDELCPNFTACNNTNKQK